jgi:hypothetical protein
VIQSLIRFLYTGRYKQNPPSGVSDLMYHAKVYVAADKYQTAALKDSSSSNYRRSALGKLHRRRSVKASIEQVNTVIKESLEAAMYVYGNTHRSIIIDPTNSLRPATAALLRKLDLYQDAASLTDWYGLISSYPDLGTDLFLDASRRLSALEPGVQHTSSWKCSKGCIKMLVQNVADSGEHGRCWVCGGLLVSDYSVCLQEYSLGYDDEYDSEGSENSDDDGEDDDWPV